MENQNTPTPSGTSPGAASAGSAQPSPMRRFLVQFALTACEEYTAPTAGAALNDAENSDGPTLHDYTGEQGPEVVAEWDPVAEDWKDIPTKPAPSPVRLVYGSLSCVPTCDLIAELYRRQSGTAADPSVEPCIILAFTPSDIAEYWESDESGATHPGSRVPEAEEMHAIRKAFERWQDTGGFHDIMHTCRDAWQAEQARQLDAQEGGRK